MLYSMTAYVRHEETTADFTICWDLRSVNHKYLEINYKLPEELRDLEPDFREITKNYINRGKLEINLKINFNQDNAQVLKLNIAKAKQVIAACEQLSSLMPNPAPVSPLELLLSLGLQSENSLLIAEKLKISVKTTLQDALVKLKANKQQEGEAIYQVIAKRVDSIAAKIQDIYPLLPTAILAYKAILLERLQTLAVTYDNGRLEQELLYLTQKIDVAEELDRLNIHVKETRRTLAQELMVGRRLDFLMQEINREVNTLAAKSIDTQISLITVDLKVLVEQIREQAQNLE